MPEDLDLLGTTEDRVDLDEFGEDEPHSLPVLRPARFEEIHQQERPFRRALVAAWRKLRNRTFRVLGVRYTGSRKAVRSPLCARKQIDFGAIEQIQWQQAIDEYLADVQGDRSIASAEQNWLRSDGVLPEQWRLAITTGVDRATVLTGAAEAALPATDAAALAEFTETAFERLSEGGVSRLQRVLTDPTYPGGSVEGIIREGIAESVNPLQTARELSARFDQYEDYEFARLARTETAFAQNFGITAELEAEGFTPTVVMAGPDHGFPPFHPNCVCSVTIDTNTGRILYDVSATACEICQSALMAEAIELEIEPVPARPAGPTITEER